MGRFDWELSGPMQILLKSCSLILFTYDKPDPKRVSACGCVAVTTSLRCIWKNRSTQNWLKLSATEPQAVNKSHRKDVAPGAGLSYPALARRHSSVGEDKASCMTRISLAGLAAGETRRMQPRKALCLAMAATRVLEKSCPWQRWNLNPSPQRDLSFNATPNTAWPRYTLCICSTGRFDWKKARPKLILQKSILTKNA